MSASSLAAPKGATTCTGTLAPGTYQSVVVPDGAVCTSDGPVRINGGVSVGSGATLALGSEENPAHTATINGGVTATNAANVQIHFSTINGAVNVTGGAGPFGGPFGVTFNTLEDNVINGSVSITGYDGFWQGFFRNTVNGSVNFNGNSVVDPDGNEVQTNTIHGDLSCSGNTPAPQMGDSGGSPNTVSGHKTGQCAGL
ncbi:MAG TPA: hypothetical protein VF091_07185 [Gaiellaceae bacterium]